MSEVVFKILKAGTSFHAMDYNGRKERAGQAKLVHMEGFGPLHDVGTIADQREMKRYLELHSSRNPRVRNPQFHAILSVRGHSHSESSMVEMARHVMHQLGYKGNPIAIYSHADTANRHLHIITSRVGLNGRKVNDRFEGMRAQGYIQQLLGQDPGKQMQTDLFQCLQYRFSSLKQFMLLLELRGYQCRERQGEISFYKHGKKQGRVDSAVVVDHIRHSPVPSNGAAEIRDMILHEMRKFDPTLVVDDAYWKKGQKEFSSALTERMRQSYGLQIVFFAGKGHDRPYGSVIIDHLDRNVYKGSDVLSIGQLNGEERSQTAEQRERTVDRGDGWRESEQREIKQGAGGELVDALEEILSGAERDLVADARMAESGVRKKKRGVKGEWR
jgi:hypothetical protein